MDTDIVAGMETGMDTVLVLSGVSSERTAQSFPYHPSFILNGVGNIAMGKDFCVTNGREGTR